MTTPNSQEELDRCVAVLMAEEGTGCCENPRGLGKYYADEHTILTPEQAYDRLRDGKSVEVPNAGAGSYQEFFKSVGLTEIDTFECCASSGDWSFTVQDQEGEWWYAAFQNNRHPGYGFKYSVDFHCGFKRKKDLMAWMSR